MALDGRRGRPNVLWAVFGRVGRPGCLLRGPDIEGRQAGRPTRRATHKVRAYHQPENCGGAWLDDSEVAASSREQSDSMIELRSKIPWCVRARTGASHGPTVVP